LKGGERLTEEKKDWRLSISLTKEQEEAIVKLRQTDEYARCSLGEVVRQLINAGLESKQGD
jgi:Arc/MetJ-type ribon-helix-helix transcriptional regulator